MGDEGEEGCERSTCTCRRGVIMGMMVVGK